MKERSKLHDPGQPQLKTIKTRFSKIPTSRRLRKNQSQFSMQIFGYAEVRNVKLMDNANCLYMEPPASILSSVQNGRESINIAIQSGLKNERTPIADNDMRKALLGAMIGCVMAFCPLYLFYRWSDGTTPVTYQTGDDTGIVTDRTNAATAAERLNATSSVHLESLSGKATPGVKKGGSVGGGSSPTTGVGTDRLIINLIIPSQMPKRNASVTFMVN